MAEKSSDEIMAEYLLKGARMLSRTCTACGSPMFEIKGETRCVVCAETKRQPAPIQNTERKEGEKVVPYDEGNLTRELSESLIVLCRKVREEPDPKRCRILMEAIEEGIEALRLLNQ